MDLHSGYRVCSYMKYRTFPVLLAFLLICCIAPVTVHYPTISHDSMTTEPKCPDLMGHGHPDVFKVAGWKPTDAKIFYRCCAGLRLREPGGQVNTLDVMSLQATFFQCSCWHARYRCFQQWTLWAHRAPYLKAIFKQFEFWLAFWLKEYYKAETVGPHNEIQS